MDPDPATLIDIDAYMPLITKTARHIREKIGRAVELDELISIGVEGLLEAAARLDPERARQFPGYAQLRIRGHILDNLGNTAALPRRAWRMVREERLRAHPRAYDPQVIDRFEGTCDRDPRGSIADALDARRLRAGIDQLADPTMRQILFELYVEGRTLSEAAHVLGVSISWASRLHQRGLALLREQLSERLAA